MMGQTAFSLTVNTTAGGLTTAVGTELNTVTNLTVTGTINAQDFFILSEQMPLLAVLDISGANIVSYFSYPENYIPGNSFYNSTTRVAKTSLKTIILPIGLTRIGTSAFQNCSGITGTLTIPIGVTIIEGGAFSGCSSITNFALPNGLTTIGNSAFSGCSGITTLTLPTGITQIGSSTFYGCSGITTLTLPAGLTHILGQAFSNCSGIKTIYSLNSTPPIYAGGFCGLTATSVTDVFVPTDAAVAAYKASWAWYGDFPGDIIKVGAPSSVPILTNSNIKVYTNQSSIIVEGTSVGETVSIYTFNGIKLKTIHSQGNRLEIPIARNTVYLVKTPGETVKVIL